MTVQHLTNIKPAVKASDLPYDAAYWLYTRKAWRMTRRNFAVSALRGGCCVQVASGHDVYIRVSSTQGIK